ncbi:orotidine 5'-phosphate decarboxylase [Pilimelia terevasa]|uniref:Orotidine 5'-phosphate decarboxylase n=1 Tax=Pilimelia terevasa TaxID=53372 RepID=A0A8J3BNY1_9ACTN|nr:orotidine-5'-phosphate decarboxylase [Pilimelia terevasa]GGK25179.1 orotidine 5'-phosphate decarboxylase [Pilimelia terevasa]
MESFGTRLRAATDRLGPLCVGVDPHPGLLAAWGLPDSVEGLASFSETVVAALAGRVAVVKPQSAFYEQYGSRGIAILESTVAQCRAAGSLVLLDVKRGDIGSTVRAYAAAYLDPARPLAADALTVAPYLGTGALEPVFAAAHAHSAGVFVLALTSNPEGASVQHARTADGRTVAQAVIDDAARRNAGATPLGDVGLVIGATIGDTGHTLTNVNGPLLAPGMGAQGGTAAGLRAVFGDALPAVLPSYSRQVLGAGPSVAALRAAAESVRDDCAAVLRG